MIVSSAVALASPAGAEPAEPTIQSITATCVDGTRIRLAPETGAVLGLCYAAHAVRAHCRPSTTGGYWVRITDTTTGVEGWVSGNLIRAIGWETLPYC
ncbi:SH3 domain-containing protein [Longispora fulva]|uniref:SH3 domain-containing protein n=1 Tax=Longispora fulva TaxID=619741 RepID=A0A8J7GC83_9ACTN|nr:SH3 domain-containing protein [Longispora fulva]MBG6134921.1 hypothetical protein [Longispora fulva]